MTNFEKTNICEIVNEMHNGSLLGIPADYSGVPMSFTKSLIKQNIKNLRLYCLPLTTIQGDMLIGSNCVSEIEAAAVSLGEFGQAPRFQSAVINQEIKVKDSTCPALHAQLQATEKGVPFMPLRGIIGSDLLKYRNDWKVIENPMKNSENNNEEIVLLPAVKLDILVFHATKADRNGNILIGRRRELSTLAHASKKVFVTVEEFSDEDFFENEVLASATLPALYVNGIAKSVNGAWPCGLTGKYKPDFEELKRYSIAAKNEYTFNAYMENFLNDENQKAAQ